MQKGRTICVADEITCKTMAGFLELMDVCENESDDDIIIVLSTMGGDSYCGWAIYDRIMESPCRITIRGYGAVMSVGALILQAGDERQLTPNTTLMIHDGSESFENIHARGLINWSEHSKKDLDRMYQIFSKKMKMPKAEIQDMCATDKVMFAKDAVKMGLADRIYNGL